MENQEKIEKDEKVGEESIEWDNVEIGKDEPQMNAQRVIVKEYEIVHVQIDTKKIGDKLVLKVKHPDSDKLLEISSVKIQKGDKLKVSGIWLKKDKDGKIPYKSAVATMMRYLNADSVKGLIGKEVDTILDENGYLAIRAY